MKTSPTRLPRSTPPIFCVDFWLDMRGQALMRTYQSLQNYIIFTRCVFQGFPWGFLEVLRTPQLVTVWRFIAQAWEGNEYSACATLIGVQPCQEEKPRPLSIKIKDLAFLEETVLFFFITFVYFFFLFFFRGMGSILYHNPVTCLWLLWKRCVCCT